MAGYRRIQSNFTSGELDERLAGREDVAVFQNGAERLENGIVQPQGGIVRRPAMTHLGFQRGVLSQVSTGGATVTTPNGGTGANLIDGDAATVLLTTTDITTTTPYVVARLDFGAPTNVSAVDVVNLELTDATLVSTGEFRVQYSTDDVAWSDFGAYQFNLRGAARSRRFALAPQSTAVLARYWRLVRVGSTNLGTARAQVAEMRFYVEASNSWGAVQCTEFTYSLDSEFEMVLTAGNIDVWEDGTWRAAVWSPYADGDVLTVNRVQSLDFMLLLHEDHAPFRVFRQGSATQWDFRDLVFDSVARYAWGDTTVSGGKNEKQRLNFSNMSNGDEFLLEINGEITSIIAWTTPSSNNGPLIEAALEALDSITSVTVTNPSGTNFDVEFDGVDGKKPQELLLVDILTGSGTVDVTRTQYGEVDKAPLWDANHGYPACGAFYQQRLWLGGFRDLGGALAASRVGEFFDFDADGDADSEPILVLVDSDEEVRFLQLYAGRHLQLFANSAEFYIPTEPITPTNIAVKKTSAIGSIAGIRPFDVDGATLYVTRSGQAVREFLFAESEQSYVSQIVSLLASHLVRTPVSVTLRRALDTADADWYVIANSGTLEDGTTAPAAILTTLRTQNITAFARLVTQGSVKAVCSNLSGSIFQVAERTYAGVTKRVFEKWRDDRYLDGGGYYTNPDQEQFTPVSNVQTVFTWTFASPATESDVGVFTRDVGKVAWTVVDEGNYTLDLVAKTVTFATAPTKAKQVLIAKAVKSITVPTFYNGQEVEITVDGYPESAVTPSGGSLDIGALELKAFFSIEYGFAFTARVRTMPFRLDTPQGSVTGVRKRVPRATASFYRTGAAKLGANGKTPRPVNFGKLGINALDLPFDEALFTGTIDAYGMRGWSEGGQVTIEGDEPVPWLCRSVAYDVAF